MSAMAISLPLPKSPLPDELAKVLWAWIGSDNTRGFNNVWCVVRDGAACYTAGSDSRMLRVLCWAPDDLEGEFWLLPQGHLNSTNPGDLPEWAQPDFPARQFYQKAEKIAGRWAFDTAFLGALDAISRAMRKMANRTLPRAMARNRGYNERREIDVHDAGRLEFILRGEFDPMIATFAGAGVTVTAYIMGQKVGS